MYSSPSARVIGFHGCERDTAEEMLSGEKRLSGSSNKYDWLGHGVYFWENNKDRALDFAKNIKKAKHPFALGAIISFGNCLNLLDSQNLKIVENGYKLLEKTFKKNNDPLPVNKSFFEHNLDCAVIQAVHAFRAEEKEQPFDSVRAVFTEGHPLYDDSGFRDQNHIQICIRNPNCIKGYFRPLTSVSGFSLF